MIVAFTGHRPDKLGGYSMSPVQQTVRSAIRRVLVACGKPDVISGMALGVDQWAAEEALSLGLRLIAAIPFEGQERVWPHASREKYAQLRAAAHEVCVVSSGGYDREKMQRRNEWMVDNCNLLVAVWDGSDGGTRNCLRYAQRTGRSVLYIDPATGITRITAR